MSTPLFNRTLFDVANAEFQKVAFVPAPNPAAAAPHGMPPQAMAQGVPMGSEGAVPPEIAAAATGQPPPADPAAQPQQPAAGMNDIDTHRQVVREEIERSQAKPKPLSPKDRITRLEGLVLRMLEHDGLIQPDPAIAEPQSQQQQPVQPAMTPTAPPPGTPAAGAAPAGQVKAASAFDRIMADVIKVAHTIRDEHGQIAQAEAALARLRNIS